MRIIIVHLDTTALKATIRRSLAIRVFSVLARELFGLMVRMGKVSLTVSVTERRLLALYVLLASTARMRRQESLKCASLASTVLRVHSSQKTAILELTVMQVRLPLQHALLHTSAVVIMISWKSARSVLTVPRVVSMRFCALMEPTAQAM